MRKLQSMVDYVLERQFPQTTEQAQSESVLIDDFFKNVTNYAKFLSMPLTLGMFVPTDEEGNVLEDPTPHGMMDKYFDKCNIWNKALSNVIFEGYSKHYNAVVNSKGEYLDTSKLNGKLTIESVIGSDLIVTQSAITKYQI